MFKKRIFSIIALVLCLVCILGACGTQEPDAGTNNPTETQGAVAETQGAEEVEETEAASAVDWEDMAEIELYYFAFAAPNNTQHVEDAINAITEPAINTHINFNVLDLNSYMSQIGIMMAGGEQIDLMLSSFGPVTYSAMLAQKQLKDISEELEIYGQDILATVGDLIKATSVGDAVYAVPAYRNLLTTSFIFMRKDVLEDLGLLDKARNMKSFDEYEEILEAVATSEKWGQLKPVMYHNGANLMMFGANLYGDFATECDIYDQLGDALGIIYCGDDGKVQLAYETESFKNAFKLSQKWAEKGWLYHDISASQSSATDYVKADFAFSYITASEFGAEAVHSANAAMDLVAVEIGSADVSAAACTKFTWCVPTTTQEPEAAVAFLNLAITSPEINTLLAWGVEGIDYEVVDGVANFIEGNENPSYHLFDYSVPNQFLVLPWGADTADVRERSLENMQSGKISPYLGFSCDTSAFSSELAAVTNVNDEFTVSIKSGQADDATYDACIKKFYDSGMDIVIEGYQKQLDEYIASQK